MKQPDVRTIEVEIHDAASERHDVDYWKVARPSSTLRGGRWSIFNCNPVVTGQRLYRLQYAHKLGKLQAEVRFEELLSFLSDRGTVPDIKGLHELRTRASRNSNWD